MCWTKEALIGLVACAVAVLCSSCSLLVDIDECTSEAGCVGEYGRGWTCTDDNLCERKALLDQSDEGPCTRSEGPVDARDAFNIGVILPLSGDEGGDGRALLSAIQLAQAEFNDLSGVAGREIGLLICDSEGRDSVALEAGEHLVEDAGVEAIIGPNFSSQTLDIANAYAIPNEVLLVSPSATAVPLSDLNDNNLIWRTVPSDALQAYAIGQLVTDLLDKEDAQAASADANPVKLTVLARENDVYAQGLRDSLSQYLPEHIVEGDEHRFSSHNYENSSAGQVGDYSDVIARIDGEETEPDIVVILGFAEAWQIARMADEALDGSPLYVLADAGRVAEEAEHDESDALDGRVWGTAPRGGDDDYGPWKAFRTKFNSSSQTEGRAENIQYVAHAYDALYAVVLAAAGSGFTGPDIARGMAELSDGEVVEAGGSDAQKGMTLRSEGKSIDLQGASGELDWNDNGDPTAGEISLWCLRDGKVPEEGVLLDRSSQFRPLSCAPASCEQDADCPVGHACESQQCSPICNDDEDCGSSHSCTPRASEAGSTCQ